MPFVILRWLLAVTSVFILSLAIMAVSTKVSAHQLKIASTTVLFNERTGNIEIMHRFILHDAEHAVRDLFDRKADIHQREATRQQFSDYVMQAFALADHHQQQLPLMRVGHEVQGVNFWVYQETPIPADLTQLQIKHKALHDLWPDQQNLVNVEGLGAVKSVIFTAESDWQAVQLN